MEWHVTHHTSASNPIKKLKTIGHDTYVRSINRDRSNSSFDTCDDTACVTHVTAKLQQQAGSISKHHHATRRARAMVKLHRPFFGQTATLLEDFYKHHQYPARVFYPLAFERSGYHHPVFEEVIDFYTRSCSPISTPQTKLQLTFSVAFAITFTTASLLKAASFLLMPHTVPTLVAPHALPCPLDGHLRFHCHTADRNVRMLLQLHHLLWTRLHLLYLK